MKKSIIFLMLTIFFAVSCSSSKKAENDADILPDEDATDVDEDNLQPDEDVTDVDDDNLQPDEDDNSSEPFFVNICTGQTKCYDSEKEMSCHGEEKAFYGQDAQYAELGKCVPRKFFIDSSAENEPLVIDEVTGLEWSQSFFEIGNYAEASDYCKNLEYGGHNDWRAPTVKELFSIIDWSRYDPAIDTDYFPKTPSANFIALSADDRYMWIINFSKGATRTTSDFNDEIYLRCVRGSDSFWKVEILSDYGGPEIYYINYNSRENKKSEIFMGGLRPYAPTWEEALKYCNDLTLAGISNWRLPNINELMFFLFHIGGGNSSYWSSTTYAEDPSGSWIFKYGSSISAEPKNSSQDNIIVLCVADAPCEKGLAWTGTDCVNFCDPNPCKEMEHSNGKCELNFYSKLDKDSFTCGCNEDEGAFWNFWQEKCVTPCEPNPCENYEHSNGVCTIHKELPTYPDNIQEYSYYCGCDEPYYWVDRQIGCVNGCIPNHCENVEHSTGGCYPGDLGWYSCECEEGYEWDWSDSCVSICDDGYLWDGFQCAPVCEPNRCEYIEHTTGECYQTGSNMFGCDCEEGYHWAYFDCEKDSEED